MSQHFLPPVDFSQKTGFNKVPQIIPTATTVVSSNSVFKESNSSIFFFLYCYVLLAGSCWTWRTCLTSKPCSFMYHMWCYVTPATLAFVIVATIVQIFIQPAGYSAWVAAEVSF